MYSNFSNICRPVFSTTSFRDFIWVIAVSRYFRKNITRSSYAQRLTITLVLLYPIPILLILFFLPSHSFIVLLLFLAHSWIVSAHLTVWFLYCIIFLVIKIFQGNQNVNLTKNNFQILQYIAHYLFTLKKRKKTVVHKIITFL